MLFPVDDVSSMATRALITWPSLKGYVTMQQTLHSFSGWLCTYVPLYSVFCVLGFFFCTFINNFCPIRHCWHYLNDAVINHLHVVVRERWCYSFRLKPWSSIVNMWIYFSGCYQGMLMCVINSLTTNVKLMGFYFFYPNKASFYTNLFMFWIPSSIPFYIFQKWMFFTVLRHLTCFCVSGIFYLFNKPVYFCTICEIILSCHKVKNC